MKVMAHKEQWLISAIECQGRVEGVQQALDAGADIDIMTEVGTPLHHAVNVKRQDVVHLLLERGASTSLVNREFLTPIELAAKQGSYQILSLLLTSRTSLQEAQLDEYLKYCVDHYIDKPGRDHDAQNHAMLAHYTSRLVGVKVGSILAKSGNLERYVVHMYGFKAAYKGQISLEGWQAQEFLPLRIYSYFEILVKLEKNIIQPLDDSADTFNKTKQQLKEEILLARETLRTVQDRLAIKTFNDVSSEKLMPLNEEADTEPQVEDFGIEEKASDVEQETGIEKQERLYQKLALGILKRVSGLKENCSYAVSIGFKDHEIYLTFMNYQNHILIRIDNLGYGCERHWKHEVYPDQICPFQLCSIERTAIVSNAALINYITELLKLKDSENTIKFDKTPISTAIFEEKKEKMKEQLDIIYRLLPIENSFRENWPQMEGSTVQQAGNCVLESQQVGLFLRSYQRGIFDWLLNQERQCIVNENRKLFVSNATEEKYWKEELLEDINLSELVYSFAFSPCQIIETTKNLIEEWAILFTGEEEILKKFQNTKQKKAAQEKGKGFFDPFDRFSFHGEGLRNDFQLEVLSAYETGDEAKLRTSLRSTSCNIYPLGRKLLALVISIFANPTENIDEYKNLDAYFSDLLSEKPEATLILFLKAMIHLKLATHYKSTYLHRIAAESLTLAAQNPLRPLLDFYVYFAKGINAYYLKQMPESFNLFSKAWNKIQRISSSKNELKKLEQNCLVCLGYLKLNEHKNFEAKDYFEKATDIQFNICLPSDIEIINPYAEVRQPIMSEQRQTRPTPESLLGLSIVYQRLADTAEIIQHKMEFYKISINILESILRTSHQENIRPLAEQYFRTVTNEISLLQSKQARAASPLRAAAAIAAVGALRAPTEKRGAAQLDDVVDTGEASTQTSKKACSDKVVMAT